MSRLVGETHCRARFRIVETERQPRSEAEAIPDRHRGDVRLNAIWQTKCTQQSYSAFNLPLVAFSLSGDPFTGLTPFHGICYTSANDNPEEQ